MDPRDATVLDLGCGYGEFINNIENSERHGMDLNPDSIDYLDKTVVFHEQDCSTPWPFQKNLSTSFSLVISLSICLTRGH